MLIARNITIGSVIAVIGLGVSSCSTSRLRPIRVLHPYFAVFDLTATPDDVLPSIVSSSLSEASEQVNQKTVARRVAVGINPAWLVAPLDNLICLMQLVYPIVPAVNDRATPPITSKTCASENEATGGKLVVTDSLMTEVGTRERNLIVGIVPDGVPTVKIVEADGRAFAIRVLRNAYEALINHPQSVEFVYEGTRHIVPVKSFSDNSRYEAPAKEIF